MSLFISNEEKQLKQALRNHKQAHELEQIIRSEALYRARSLLVSPKGIFSLIAFGAIVARKNRNKSNNNKLKQLKPSKTSRMAQMLASIWIRKYLIDSD